jgi:hypothetical protein
LTCIRERVGAIEADAKEFKILPTDIVIFGADKIHKRMNDSKNGIYKKKRG